MRGRLILTLRSDTCFSMPATRDAPVDSDVSLDTLGLPQVSGKTLHGLLRDTWLSAYPFLGDPDKKIGQTLLGNPRSHAAEGILRIGDARLEPEVLEWVRAAQERSANTLSLSAVREAFLTARMLTAMDPEKGAPKTDTLRMVRVIPKGTTLVAPLETYQQLTPPQNDLLNDLAALTRHAGLDRNRGLGHICLSVKWDKAADVEPLALAVDSGYLHLRLALTGPCLITGRDLDQNSRRTRPFVTGAALRGAVAGAMERAGKSQAEIERVVASGEVRFLNGYPEVDGRRAMPTPITWQRDKDARYEDTHDKAKPAEAIQSIATSYLWDKQRQAIGTPFFAQIGSEYRAAQPKRRLTTHQTRHRPTGVADKQNKATVYVYEALEAEQSIRTCLALPDDPALRADILALLQTPLWLGRSARSGYGGAPTVTVLPQMTRGRQQEFGGTVEGVEEGAEFVVCLTSDAVLRDPKTGQHDPWRLKAELESGDRFGGVAEVVLACVQAGTAMGFHRLWRTTLPSVPCAAMGSTVLMRAKPNRAISAAEIQAIQNRPLGERTVEGCGCFIVTADTISKDEEPAFLTLKGPQTKTMSLEPEGDAPELVMKAQKRVYRERLRRLAAAQALADAAPGNARNLPSASLLQRLRGPLATKTGTGWQERYRTWLADDPIPGPGGKDLRLKKAARADIQQARLGEHSLMAFLTAAAKDDWAPVLSGLGDDRFDEAVERENCRLIPTAKAAEVWQVEKANLGVLYLRVLLGRLARRAQRHV